MVDKKDLDFQVIQAPTIMSPPIYIRSPNYTERQEKTDLEKLIDEYASYYKNLINDVINYANKIFGTNYNVDIVYKKEAKKKLGKEINLPDNYVAYEVRNNTIYVILDEINLIETMYRSERYKDKITKILGKNFHLGQLIELISYSLHESMHRILHDKYPILQEKVYIYSDLVNDHIPAFEFFAELFSNLIIRMKYGDRIPEHELKIDDFIVGRVNNIKLWKSNYGKMMERLEHEGNMTEIDNLLRGHIVWGLLRDKSYMLAEIVAKEMYKKYGNDSINNLLEKTKILNEYIRKSNNIEQYYGLLLDFIIDKDIRKSIEIDYKSVLDEVKEVSVKNILYKLNNKE